MEQTLILFVPSALAGPVLLPRPILSPFHATKQFLLALTSSLRHAHPVFTVVHCSTFALLAITYTTRLLIVPIIVVVSRRITIFATTDTATSAPAQTSRHIRSQLASHPRSYTFARCVAYTSCQLQTTAAHSPARIESSRPGLNHALTAPARSITSVLSLHPCLRSSQSQCSKGRVKP